jgi:hypothetical protein
VEDIAELNPSIVEEFKACLLLSQS